MTEPHATPPPAVQSLDAAPRAVQPPPGGTPSFPPVTPRRSGASGAWWGIAAVLISVAAITLAYQALRSEMTTQYAATQKELDTLRAELRNLRDALDAEDPDNVADDGPAVAPNTVHINVNGYPVLGNPKASLVMVEFTDFQCPYCAKFHATTYPALKKSYVDTQRMRYVSVDFPLEFHGLAFKAAEAAHCGDQQGQYFPVFDKLFQASPRIDPGSLVKIAEGLGLNAASFKECLSSGAMEPKVRRGLAQSAALGIDGTPTFVIGRAEGGVVRGRMIVGAYPIQVFDDLIRSHLALK
jgi:protein-disulfide isomerase